MTCRKLSKHVRMALKMGGDGVPNLQQRAQRLAMSLTLVDRRNIAALLERARRYQGVDQKGIDTFRAFVEWVEDSPDAKDADRELAKQVRAAVLDRFTPKPTGAPLVH